MDRHYDLLWVRLTEIYGQLLVQAYGLELPSAWRDALSGVEPAAVRRGLGACATSGDVWPPSLPTFLQRCGVVANGHWQHGTGAYREFRRDRLLEEQCSPEVRDGCMARMREALR